MSPAKKPAKAARTSSQPGRVAQADCPHPRDKRKFVGYAVICEDCKKVNP